MMFKDFLYFVIILFLMITAWGYSRAQAFELDRLSIQYMHYTRPPRLPEIWPHSARERVSLDLDVNVWRCFDWRNSVHGTSTSGQFIGVGWIFSVLCDLGRISSVPLSFGLYHHSQHYLDHLPPYGFPVEDAIIVEWRLYGRK